MNTATTNTTAAAATMATTVPGTTTSTIPAPSSTDTRGGTLQFHMPEEVPTQPELQPQSQSLAQLPPSREPVATGTTTETAIAPQQNSSSAPSSKLPLMRPRKIRKLSPETPINSDCTTTTTAPCTALTTVPDRTKPTAAASASRNARSKMIVAQSRPLVAIPHQVIRSLSCEGEIEIALRHLRNADPHLARLIDLYQPPTFDSFQTPFLALSKSIIYQQLAYKAGTSIYARFVALCGGEGGVVPETVLALTPQQLRQIGVSGRKASYLHDLARKYQNGILSDSSVINMDDKSLFTMLTMVNGIGLWSVHMFMIFSLHRPDVLPVNDLGVRKGVQLLYGLEELPRPSQMEQLCEKWRPYRSVASWYLWRFVESKGSPSSAAAVSASGITSQPQPHSQQQQPDPQQQQQQQQPSSQFLDCSGMINLGACAWGQ